MGKSQMTKNIPLRPRNLPWSVDFLRFYQVRGFSLVRSIQNFLNGNKSTGVDFKGLVRRTKNTSLGPRNPPPYRVRGFYRVQSIRNFLNKFNFHGS